MNHEVIVPAMKGEIEEAREQLMSLDPRRSQCLRACGLTVVWVDNNQRCLLVLKKEDEEEFFLVMGEKYRPRSVTLCPAGSFLERLIRDGQLAADETPLIKVVHDRWTLACIQPS